MKVRDLIDRLNILIADHGELEDCEVVLQLRVGRSHDLSPSRNAATRTRTLPLTSVDVETTMGGDVLAVKVHTP